MSGGVKWRIHATGGGGEEGNGVLLLLLIVIIVITQTFQRPLQLPGTGPGEQEWRAWQQQRRKRNRRHP